MLKTLSFQRVSRARLVNGLRVIAFLFFPGLLMLNDSLASPFDSSAWKRFRDIHVPPHAVAGPIGVPLDSVIFQHSRPDLADLRVVSSEGAAVPVTVSDSFHHDEPTPFPGVLFKIIKRPGKWTDVWIDKKAKILTRGVLLQTTSKNFARKVEVRGSDNGSEAYVILMDALVCDLPGPIPVRSLEVLHPLNNFRYIHLRILDGDQAPLKVDGALCFPAPVTGPWTQPGDVRIVENRMNSSDNSTVVIADLGEKRFPLRGIKISTPTASFVKKVRLLQESPDSPDSWRPFYEGTFFRIEKADAGKESLEARFEPQSRRHIMLELTGSGPAVTVKTLEAKAALRVGVFMFRPGLTYRLFYDHPRAKAFSSDNAAPPINLTRVLAASGDVSFGDEQKNVVSPRPRPMTSQKKAHPTTVGKILGVVMLLIGLLLLFIVMLRARSQRMAERRRGSRVLDTRL
jgi:hypothetical protein